MANQNKPIENPFTGELQLTPAIERGVEIRHLQPMPILVKAGYTRLNPDLIIPEGITVTIEEGAELLVL